MNRSEKEQHVESLRRELQGIQNAFLFGYRGLTVNQVTDLRTRIRKTSSTYRVLKNRLAARAMETTDLAPLREHLRGPLAMTFHPELARMFPCRIKVGSLPSRPMVSTELPT